MVMNKKTTTVKVLFILSIIANSLFALLLAGLLIVYSMASLDSRSGSGDGILFLLPLLISVPGVILLNIPTGILLLKSNRIYAIILFVAWAVAFGLIVVYFVGQAISINSISNAPSRGYQYDNRGNY